MTTTQQLRCGQTVRVLTHKNPNTVGKQGIITALTLWSASVSFDSDKTDVRQIPLSDLEIVE